MTAWPALAIALLGGVIVPWAVMRMLMVSLAGSERATALNHRGARVVHGLGIVWLVWGVCALLYGLWADQGSSLGALSVLPVAGLLAIVAFGFGLVDDVYGSRDARGFKGHLGALFRGRLTTGGLKLVGIGSVSLASGLYVADLASWGQGPERPWAALTAAAAIALTANLSNLFDLRPGRALKVHSLLVTFGWCLIVLVWIPFVTHGAGQAPAGRVVDAAALALFLAGPVLSIWRYDLGEIGMLGDAGANPMGVVAGALIVTGLPLAGVIAYAFAVLALNLASEKVSFSAVIEHSAPLRWLDMLGRRPEGSNRGASGHEASHGDGSGK